MININEEYTTAGGCPVRFYANSGGGIYSIHGAYLLENIGWMFTAWKADGKSCSHRSLDLVKKVQPAKYIPFSDDMLEELVGQKVKRKDCGSTILVEGYYPDRKKVMMPCFDVYSAEELLENFLIKDGKNWRPCGQKVE